MAAGLGGEEGEKTLEELQAEEEVFFKHKQGKLII